MPRPPARVMAPTAGLATRGTPVAARSPRRCGRRGERGALRPAAGALRAGHVPPRLRRLSPVVLRDARGTRYPAGEGNLYRSPLTAAIDRRIRVPLWLATC